MSVSLQKGQKVSLTKDNAGLARIVIGLGWDEVAQKKISFFTPHYEMNFKGWNVKGNFLEWDYNIVDSAGRIIAMVNKELFNFTDTYSIETVNDEDALYALMLTLAIDAENK